MGWLLVVPCRVVVPLSGGSSEFGAISVMWRSYQGRRRDREVLAVPCHIVVPLSGGSFKFALA
jgi:hypothetical protein